MEEMYIAYMKMAAYIGGSIVMGIGTIAPALAQGAVAAKAVEILPKMPESYSNIRSLMLVGMSIIETAPLYAFIIALILILFT